jgi:hypothetical protein
VTGPGPAQDWMRVSSHAWVTNGSFVLDAARNRPPCSCNTVFVVQCSLFVHFLPISHQRACKRHMEPLRHHQHQHCGIRSWYVCAGHCGSTSPSAMPARPLTIGWPSPSGVYFDGGGTWNHNGTVTITITNTTTGTGVGTCARGHRTVGALYCQAQCLLAHSPLVDPPASGVYFDGGGAWNHNGTGTITINNTTAGTGYRTRARGPTHCGSAFVKRNACSPTHHRLALPRTTCIVGNTH